MTSTNLVQPDPYPAVSLDDELIKRALDATLACILSLGIPKTSMDDIAAESGISRATLYRRFGSREGIFQALLRQQALPYIEHATRRTANAQSLAERIEINTVCAVLDVPQYPALKLFFEQAASSGQLDMIHPVYQQLVSSTLIPQLEAARHAGEMRPNLNLESVAEWLLRGFTLLVLHGEWEEESLRQHVRQFILPVLIIDPPASTEDEAKLVAMEQKLSAMEQQLTHIQQLLETLIKA